MPDITVSTSFECCASADAVAARAADIILDAAQTAIRARGRFLLMLSGGRTPLATYALLAHRHADWMHWHVFLGDERCVPRDDPARTSTAVARLWLDVVELPEFNRHFIAAERDPEQAAADYAHEISPYLPFDLVLLGMGEDGHVASLFPGHESLADHASLVIRVHDAPKPPPERISLTPKALCAARERLVLITGGAKRQALHAWRAGADVPIARVATGARVLLDHDASPGDGEAADPCIHAPSEQGQNAK